MLISHLMTHQFRKYKLENKIILKIFISKKMILTEDVHKKISKKTFFKKCIEMSSEKEGNGRCTINY